MARTKTLPLQICDTSIQPGERVTLALPTPELYTCTPAYIPIHVIHGKQPGPCLLVCAAIHGDEMNGVSIIQRLLELGLLKKIHGTLIAVPVINIYGLLTQSRTLPDRRDLDGSFPGSESGSYASRLAHLFTQEILKKATHCIDIHTGEPHYYNMPQIITNIDRKDALSLGKSFQAPIVVHDESDRGLLWQMKLDEGIPTIIYQGGEALRLDDLVIKTGVKGIIRVMRDLGMLKLRTKKGTDINPLEVRKTTWIRSPASGLCECFKKAGSHVREGDKLAMISDPFGAGKKYQVNSPVDGVIIANNRLPLVNEGESILQIAETLRGEKHITEWSETGHYPKE